MEKSAIYLRRSRNQFTFKTIAFALAIIGAFIFLPSREILDSDYAILLTQFALCVGSLGLLMNVAKGGIDEKITIYHRLLKSDTNKNQIVIYNLSCQNLLIFSIYLNIKNEGGWYIHNSIEHPIKLKTLDNIKISLTNDDMSNVSGNAKDEQLSLITSFGKVKSRKLDNVLMTQEEIRASIIQERDPYSPPEKDN